MPMRRFNMNYFWELASYHNYEFTDLVFGNARDKPYVAGDVAR